MFILKVKWKIVCRVVVLLMTFLSIGTTLAQRERKPLAAPFNSKFEELKPMVSGGSMYFVRTLHPSNNAIQSIWVSDFDYDKNRWSQARLLDTNINLSKRFNALCKVSEDKSTFYLNNATTDKKSWKAGITKAIKTRRGWRYESFYECPFKSSGFVDFWVSENDDLIFFSAKKSKSRNEDIYIVKSDSAGWKQPVMLEGINSKFVEASPFYDVENRILFITSNRNGNYDIFGSQAVDNSLTNWSTLTYSDFNTEMFEGYYSVGKQGEIYFVSQKTPALQLDIFQYALPGEPMIQPIEQEEKPSKWASLTVKVTDKKSGEALEAKVELESGDVTSNKVTENGAMNYSIPMAEKVKITVSQQGYYPKSEEVMINKMKMSIDIALDPVEVGKTIILRNIFFDSDQAYLKPESYPELEMLAGFMSSHPGVKIKITGHTDDQGEANYNLKLSQDRIEAVLDYLVEQGVEKERIVGEGMGEKQPISTNKTEDGRAQNRRVEFTILEK